MEGVEGKAHEEIFQDVKAPEVTEITHVQIVLKIKHRLRPTLDKIIRLLLRIPLAVMDKEAPADLTGMASIIPMAPTVMEVSFLF